MAYGAVDIHMYYTSQVQALVIATYKFTSIHEYHYFFLI